MSPGAFQAQWWKNLLNAEDAILSEVGKIPKSKIATPVFLPENPMDRRAWRTTVHRIAMSQA